MNDVIRSWDIRVGDVRQLGSMDFSSDDLACFQKEEVEAIRRLCKKVLESQAGSEIATKAYREGCDALSFSVSFDTSEGLFLNVNNTPHLILSAKDVLEGRQGSFFKEIKQISAAAERQGIKPVRTDRIQTLFKKAMEDRKEEAAKPLFGRIQGFVQRGLKKIGVSALEIIFGLADVFSVARNSVSAAHPAALTPFGALALVGGSLISLGGLYLVIESAVEFGAAILHKSYEKGCLVFADIVLAFSVVMTGILFLMEWGAHFAKQVLTSAAAGAVIPFFIFGMYISSFAKNVYKAVVIGKFRSDLHAILERKDKEEGKKLREALLWMRQKAHLSDLEVSEHLAKAEAEGKNAFVRMRNALYEKWDAFALRAGGEAYELISSLFEENTFPALLEGLQNNDSAAIAQAKEVIANVSKKSGEEFFWSIVGAIYNLIGAAAMTIYLAFSGGAAASLASSIIFAVAAFISLFVDVEAVRKLPVYLKENFPIFISSMIYTLCVYISKDLTLFDACALLVKKFRELKKKKCAESDNPVQKEECQRSETSSTSSAARRGLPQTPLMLTDGTLPLSQAS